jgi:hypothetical protein
MGRWYEIAVLPKSFERQCVRDTAADYRLRRVGSNGDHFRSDATAFRRQNVVEVGGVPRGLGSTATTGECIYPANEKGATLCTLSGMRRQETAKGGATMMRVMPFGALSLAIVGLVLLGLTFMNLGSGGMEERTCQAACLQAYFFSASAASGFGLILGILGLTKPNFRGVTYLALVLLVPLCCVIGGLILIGNFG